jgi:hypothetical protein
LQAKLAAGHVSRFLLLVSQSIIPYLLMCLLLCERKDPFRFLDKWVPAAKQIYHDSVIAQVSQRLLAVLALHRSLQA